MPILWTVQASKLIKKMFLEPYILHILHTSCTRILCPVFSRWGLSKFSAGLPENILCTGSKLHDLCYFMITNPWSCINVIITKNELKTQDFKMTFDVRCCPLLSIRKFPVHPWLGVWPDFRNPTLTSLQGSEISKSCN